MDYFIRNIIAESLTSWLNAIMGSGKHPITNLSSLTIKKALENIDCDSKFECLNKKLEFIIDGYKSDAVIDVEDIGPRKIRDFDLTVDSEGELLGCLKFEDEDDSFIEYILSENEDGVYRFVENCELID